MQYIFIPLVICAVTYILASRAMNAAVNDFKDGSLLEKGERIFLEKRY